MRNKTSLVCGAALGVMLACGLGVAAHAQDNTTAWKGAPQWSNDDVYFKVRGRILVDGVFQDVTRDGTATDYKTSNIRGRQVFLGIEGKLNNYIAYKAEGGWVNGGTPTWDDVVIEVKPTETTSILFGNIKATGLENLTSTRFTTFMDRGPYGDMGVDSYLLSVVGKVNGPNWSVTGAIQGDSINNADINNTSATLTNNQNSNERLGFTGRVHYAPILTDFDKVHLAVSARYRNHGNEGAFNYQGRTDTNYGTNGLYYKTGAIGDRDTTLAAEGMWIHNSLSVQGEYSNIKVERLATSAPGSNPDVKVGYAFVSFWPTGEQRNYDATTGEVKRPKILNPITAGGFGGVELALRYDYADLTEAYKTASTVASKALSADAGKYTAWTLGVNYYPTAYVRFQANYTDGSVDPVVALHGSDIKQFQLRAQLDF
ncbi:OprO/OprP family phosphate-selective porin [Caulobacter soli]|uniref:OprO/OprP family phosphate-selective porin n=1 Tax=Caulobacter soli TaxID=2708539 RepID=UPI0013EBE14D|nr:porin [Caulobacter soli]